MRYVKKIRANTKGQVYHELGPRTIIVGPNGSRKTAIVNAVELALSGKASDIQGRSLVADMNQLLTLRDHGGSESPLFSVAVLDNGEEALWEAKGKKGQWTKTPSVFDAEKTFPLRTVREALAGSVETTRKFFLRFVGDTVTLEDVMAQIPTPLHERLKKVLPAGNADASAAILTALENAKDRLNTARAEAKAAAAVVAGSASGQAAPPSGKLLEEAKAALAAARAKVVEYEKELSIIEAQAKFGELRDQKRVEAEQLQARLESLGGELLHLRDEFTRTPQRPTPADKVRENLISVLGFLTEKPSKSCPCCGGDVNVEDFPYGRRLVEMRKKHEERQKVFARATEIEVAIKNGEHECEVMRADLVRLNEDGLAEDTSDAPTLQDQADIDQAVHHARLEAEEAEKRVLELERARGAWEQVKRSRDEVAMREEEAASWGRLVDTLKETVGTLLGQAKGAFEGAVQRHLPDDYHFALVLTEEDREVCRYGFLRNGVIDTAVCGGEWAMLLGALTAAAVDADDAPDDMPRVIVPPDTGWDSSKLVDVMLAFKNVPAQIIIATTTRPERVPDGWTLIDLYGTGQQLPMSETTKLEDDEEEVEEKPAKKGKKSAQPKPSKASRKKKSTVEEGGEEL